MDCLGGNHGKVRMSSRLDAPLHALLFGGLFNVRFGPSRIHGTGSFATRRIKEGESIFMPFQPREEMAFINHADSPNIVRSHSRLLPFAIRDIHEGEEITEDYRLLRLFINDPPEAPSVGRGTEEHLADQVSESPAPPSPVSVVTKKILGEQ